MTNCGISGTLFIAIIVGLLVLDQCEAKQCEVDQDCEWGYVCRHPGRGSSWLVAKGKGRKCVEDPAACIANNCATEDACVAACGGPDPAACIANNCADQDACIAACGGPVGGGPL